MRGCGLIAVGALCSVTVAVGVAGVTRADRRESTSGMGSVASPLSVGPVTGLPGVAVALAQGQWTNAGEATLSVLGRQAVWEVTLGRSGRGRVTSTTPLPAGADPVVIACR